MDNWILRSDVIRNSSSCRTNLCYGDGERDKLDFFAGSDKKGPLLIYIHGGYWQRGDKHIYGFISEAFVRQGISVAILNYNLTPSVRIGQIPDQIRTAILWCWQHANELGFDPYKLFVSGHSAGAI